MRKHAHIGVRSLDWDDLAPARFTLSRDLTTMEWSLVYHDRNGVRRDRPLGVGAAESVTVDLGSFSVTRHMGDQWTTAVLPDGVWAGCVRLSRPEAAEIIAASDRVVRTRRSRRTFYGDAGRHLVTRDGSVMPVMDAIAGHHRHVVTRQTVVRVRGMIVNSVNPRPSKGGPVLP